MPNPRQSRTEKADANPSKTFFITMLTRDIALSDCILDLLDNSVDGIGNAAKRRGQTLPENGKYRGHRVTVSFDDDHFSITDKSGGISINDAKHYAFRFGRPDKAPELLDGSIGLYGIGMKRALFKMGKHIHLTSSTGDESFELDLDVEHWRRNLRKDWTFALSNVKHRGTNIPAGTVIRITDLYAPISREFKNPHFCSALVRQISRDYAFILQHGLQVVVNKRAIQGNLPKLRESDELHPFRHQETLDGVRIEIQAGIADPPPEDTSATARHPEVEAYGWYVVCNERVVVTADKTSLTGWGRPPVPTWHPQFIGFMGVVRFDAQDPRDLPWKTTKRDVEASNPAYQHALIKMMEAAKEFIDYTNRRRAATSRARKIENKATGKPVGRVKSPSQMRFPDFGRNQLALIQYAKPREDIDAVAEALRLLGASPAEVGSQTFDYCFKREVKR